MRVVVIDVAFERILCISLAIALGRCSRAMAFELVILSLHWAGLFFTVLCRMDLCIERIWKEGNIAIERHIMPGSSGRSGGRPAVL